VVDHPAAGVPMVVYHRNIPDNHHTADGPMLVCQSDIPVDHPAADGPMLVYHSDIPDNHHTADGPMLVCHSDIPVDHPAADGLMLVCHSDIPVDHHTADDGPVQVCRIFVYQHAASPTDPSSSVLILTAPPAELTV